MYLRWVCWTSKSDNKVWPKSYLSYL